MANSSFWGKLVKFLLTLFFTFFFLFLGWAYAYISSPRSFSVFPESGEIVVTNKRVIGASWSLFPGEKIEIIRLNLDGKDITGKVDSNDSGFTCLCELAEGGHTVQTILKYSFIKRKIIEKTWLFKVDAVAPEVSFENMIGNKIGVARESTILAGQTEPNTLITANLNGVPLKKTSSTLKGEFLLSLDNLKRLNKLKIKAIDAAKNVTDETFLVMIDDSVPVITEVLPLNESIVKNNKVRIEAKIGGVKSDIRAVIYVSGKPVDCKVREGSVEIFTDELILDEGDYQVKLFVKGISGNTAMTEWVFKVDSTNEFGFLGLRRGAKGRDVMELQARLQAHGYYQGRVTGVFDEKTEKAVITLQLANNRSPNGIIGFDETNILKPARLNITEPFSDAKIVISVSKRALYLARGDELLRIYPIAVGSAGFSTPIRRFTIVRKDINPTWYPPNWADVKEPVPPGPGNPLGNRRLLLSDRSYGIHGTNKISSIGKAVTHAVSECTRGIFLSCLRQCQLAQWWISGDNLLFYIVFLYNISEVKIEYLEGIFNG
ncbi:MAG: L,D-transpeptidase family protein [Candidatus Subteraquimicrobiales bacterium]|nr:L,D-transpeptidase family protein [Candidatus Subteraquimicrobiales bacterium]